MQSILIATLAIALGLSSGFGLFGFSRDHLAYLDAYDYLRISDSLDILRFEPGYVLLSWIFKFVFHFEFLIFFSFLAASALSIKLWLYSQHPRPVLTILFYLSIWYPLHEYTQIRAAVAVSLCLLATEAYFQRRFIFFVTMMALAFTFHSSAVLVAVMLPIAHVLSSFRLAGVVLGTIGVSTASAFAAPFIFSVSATLNPLAENYFQNLDGNSVNIFSVFNILAAALLLSILFSNSLKDSRDRSFFVLGLFGLTVSFTFQDAPVFSHRVKEFLFVFIVPIMFSEKFTPKEIPRFVTAFLFCAANVYSHIDSGLIGASQ